jgi:hypothetical protein
MEVCGGSQHGARQLVALGHEVKLMPAEFVKAFNIRNKNLWSSRFCNADSDFVVGLRESIRRLEGEHSPRHDESRARRTSE